MNLACTFCGSTERNPKEYVKRDGEVVVICSEYGGACLRERMVQDGVRMIATPEGASPEATERPFG